MSTEHVRRAARVEQCGVLNTVHPDAFEIRYQFINTTARSLTVVDQLGLSFEVRPSHDTRTELRDCFIVRQQINMSGDQYHALRARLERYNCGDSPFIVTLSRTLANKNHYNTLYVVVIEHIVSAEVLREASLPVVLDHLGFMVMPYQPGEVPAHPDSEAGQLGTVHARPEKQSSDYGQSSLEINVQLIDNEKRIGPRFVNVLNKTIRVVPQVDHRKRSGAYVSHTPTTGIHSFGDTVTQYVLDMPEVTEANGFYETQEQAAVLGDSKLLQARLERDNLQLKANLGTQSAERDRHNHDFQRDKMRYDRIQLHEEHVYGREERYEARSQNRWRFFTDSIKHIGGGLTALFGLFKLFKAFKPA